LKINKNVYIIFKLNFQKEQFETEKINCTKKGRNFYFSWENQMQNVNILIRGQKKLAGSVAISGAKNAALPELAAVVLSSGEFVFQNVPAVDDINVLFKALKNIGGEGQFKSNSIDICIPVLKSGLVPKNIVETSRASILMLGPLLARNGFAKVSLPGGCPIGDRKINFHLEGLRKMGATIQVEDGHIFGKTKKLKGINYSFPNKTVTGTENLLMAATLAQGTTVLENCAAEPEIIDLIDLLKKMGAVIDIVDQDTLVIKGKSSLQGAHHKIIIDRIELGTYVIAGCLMDNEVIIKNAVPEYINSLLNILERIGINVKVENDTIKVNSNRILSPIDIETEPYPGFPTDLQAQLTTLLTQANGTSRIRENIFNNRFQHVAELNKLGANIEVKDNTAIIKGKTELKGKIIKATDLRASAALVLGGLIADGTTEVENSHQLFRGYENMPKKLQLLGAELELAESPRKNNIK